MKKLLIFALILVSGAVSAQEQNTTSREFEMTEGDTTYIMKQYFMLLYLSGDNKEEISKERSQELQKGHLAHINKMAEEGAVSMAGPFGDDTEKRGVLIFDLDTIEEVVEWVSQDPLVKAGRLKYEIHPWWTAKGSCLE